ncbi:rolling circle replication-associated protein [Leuconostoc mesenteroides]
MDLKEYTRKTTDFGNGMLEVVTYNRVQTRLTGVSHLGGATDKSEISDEAQTARTKKQTYAIKRKIRGYALANPFEWFVTLTIDPQKDNSFDYEIAKISLLKWCRWMRNKYEKFDYLVIPELHKSGAVHFHGLLGDISANFIEAKNPKTGKSIIRNERQVYNLNDWKHGFSDCEKIISRERTASYITKYITKELMTDKSMFRKNRYFNSTGLKKPEVTLEIDDNSDLISFIPNFGVIETDKLGNNHLEKGIYNLTIDKDTGTINQTSDSYLLVAKKVD